MTLSTDANRTRRELVRQGFVVTRQANGHYEVRSPSGKEKAIVGATPSSYRGFLNDLARLRRLGYADPSKGDKVKPNSRAVSIPTGPLNSNNNNNNLSAPDRVIMLMADGKPRTLEEIAEGVGLPAMAMRPILDALVKKKALSQRDGKWINDAVGLVIAQHKPPIAPTPSPDISTRILAYLTATPNQSRVEIESEVMRKDIQSVLAHLKREGKIEVTGRVVTGKVGHPAPRYSIVGELIPLQPIAANRKDAIALLREICEKLNEALELLID